MTSTLSIQEQYEKLGLLKHTDAFEDYFQRLKNLMENAVELQENELIKKTLQFHLLPLTAGSYNNLVFYLLKEYEGYFHTYGKELLGLYYQVLGQVFYCRFEHEKANKYFKYAISISMEHKDFVSLSTSMNNYLLKDMEMLTESASLTISKSIPLILKASNDYPVDELISKLYLYIQMCVYHGKYQNIELLLNNIIDGDYIKGDCRFQLQLQLMKSLIFMSKGEFEQARDALLYVFDTCIKTKQNNDILIHVYKEIVFLNSIQEDLIECDLLVKLDEMKQAMKNESEVMLKYTENNKWYLPIDYPFTFGIKPTAFKSIARNYMENVEGVGNTLIIMECIQHKYNREELNRMLVKLHAVIEDEFQSNLVSSSVLDQSMMTLIVSLNEEEVSKRLKNARAIMVNQFPLETSNLLGVYFAYVNNVENNFTSFDDCMNLAYAYMYYKLKQ